MKQYKKMLAIKLRKNGYSYSEINKEISVSKSTLSQWLRSIILSQKLKRKLLQKRVNGGRSGGQKRRANRLETTNKIYKESVLDIGKISERELWLIGIVLYWAEGAKAKEDYNISQGILFSNSDPLMIQLFLLWLRKSLLIPASQIAFHIYLHESSMHRIGEVKHFWASKTGIPIEQFGRIYYKKDRLRSNRRNKGSSYFGQLRINVRKSTILNRKITAWILAIGSQCGVV